jgi:hypothetical protein
MLAAMAKVPELELEKEEAEKLTANALEVAKLYSNIEADPKTIAWINLAFCAGQIYGPRVVAYRIRKSQERRVHQPQPQPQQQQRPQENVVMFSPDTFAAPPDRGTVG